MRILTLCILFLGAIVTIQGKETLLLNMSTIFNKTNNGYSVEIHVKFCNKN